MALTLTLALNIALLVTLSVVHQSIVRRWRVWNLARLVTSGLLFGLISVMGMMTPFRAAEGIQYDGRSIVLAVAGLFGGPIVALVAGLIAAAYRLWLGGAGAVAGVTVIAEAAVLGVAYHYLRGVRPRVMRWLPLYGFGVLVHAVMLLIQFALLGDAGPAIVARIWLPVIGLYPLGLLLVCRLMLDQEQRLEDEHALRTVNEYLERIVEERTNELRATNEQLHEANEAKSQFLRAMSHELRTPLNSVIGFSDILTRGITGDVSPEQRRQLEMINRSGRRLLAIVDDVLDLSRIEAHVVPVTTETFDAEALARELVDSVTPDATAKGLSLSVHGPEHDAILETDPDKVEQILLNLITNAVKYTDTGGVTIRIRRPGHSMIAFDVIDTGPGIPDELKEQVFEEFMQGDEHREGTGLGLAISRRLAELLGGTITLASQVGEGSTFTLLLPEGAPRHASSRSRG